MMFCSKTNSYSSFQSKNCYDKKYDVWLENVAINIKFMFFCQLDFTFNFTKPSYVYSIRARHVLNNFHSIKYTMLGRLYQIIKCKIPNLNDKPKSNCYSRASTLYCGSCFAAVYRYEKNIQSHVGLYPLYYPQLISLLFPKADQFCLPLPLYCTPLLLRTQSNGMQKNKPTHTKNHTQKIVGHCLQRTGKSGLDASVCTYAICGDDSEYFSSANSKQREKSQHLPDSHYNEYM